MAATLSTTAAAGLHAPSKPTAASCIDTVQSGSETTIESPERVDVQFWQASQQALSPESYLPLVTLDENGKPPFYRECSDAIRYSSTYIFCPVYSPVCCCKTEPLLPSSSINHDHAHSGVHPTILPRNLPTICPLPLPSYRSQALAS